MNKILLLCSSSLLFSCAQIKKSNNLSQNNNMIVDNVATNAIKKCQEGKLEKGIDELKSIFKEERKNASYWNALSSCYFFNEDWSKAEFHLNMAQELNKGNDAYLLNNKGLLYYRLGHIEDALTLLESAFQKQKNNREIVINLSQVLLEQSLFQRMIETIGPLAEKNNLYHQDQQIISFLAIALTNNNHIDSALKLFNMLKNNPENGPQVLLYYSVALSKKGKWSEASLIFENIKGDFSPAGQAVYQSLKEEIEEHLRSRG